MKGKEALYQEYKKKVDEATTKSTIIENVLQHHTQVSEQVQSKVTGLLSHISSSALQTVLDKGQEAGVEISIKRGVVSGEVYYKKNGQPLPVAVGTAGGERALISLALRVAILKLFCKKRQILLLDEPMAALRGSNYAEEGAKLIQDLAQKFDIQVLMISHESSLIDQSNNIINLGKA